MNQQQTGSSFFQAGGTLPLEAPYVERAADNQLRRATRAGDYCNVLTARQMGKSSIMVRTAAYLKENGVRTAALDLTDIGVELSADEWYFGLVSRLKQALKLRVDERQWWREREQQGVVQRFSDFLRDVILEEIAEPVVVFVDEIDSTLSLPFADDFFASIRAAYNARASDPTYKRLAFVLLGVARPGDLIKDRARTPYNIGTSIDLTDFTFAEAKAFLPGLETETSPARAEAVLKRVLHWTGGHPYLTQKVCAEIAASPDGLWDDAAVDALVKRLFLSDEARKESNLQYIGDRIRESSDREKLLRRYEQVLAGKQVPDEERDPINSQLKLAGLTNVTAGRLVVRNRIYETVFNARWIKDNMPTVTANRVTAIAVAVAVIALVIGGLVFYLQPSGVQVQAETLAQNFQSSESPVLRLNNLAGLFRLDEGAFAADARDIFFELPPEQQLALFGVNDPTQVGADVETVVRGLYTHLDRVEAIHRTALLHTMAETLTPIENDTPALSSLSSEIEDWLEGRRQAQAGDNEAAIDSYTRAIEAWNKQNPALYADRALAYADLGDYKAALADLEQLLVLDPARRDQAMHLIEGHSGLQTYWQDNQADFPALVSGN